jgi:hypothetical protein
VDHSKAYRRAKRRVAIRIGFIIHFACYFLVTLMLMAINLFTWDGYPWFIWPFMTWGVVVAMHGLLTFLATSGSFGEWKKQMIEDEMRRQTG